MSDAQQARRYFVSGGVQGVGFRYFTLNAAKKLQVQGYVRNLRDGRVEVFAIGTPQQLVQFRAVLEHGPRFASVSRVDEENAEVDARFANDFIVTHDG